MVRLRRSSKYGDNFFNLILRPIAWSVFVNKKIQILKESLFYFWEVQCSTNTSSTFLLSAFSNNRLSTVITSDNSVFAVIVKMCTEILFRKCGRSIGKHFCLVHVYLNFGTETKQLFTLELFS